MQRITPTVSLWRLEIDELVSSIEWLGENFNPLITHFRIKNSFRSNNITESVNDKIEMKLKMI